MSLFSRKSSTTFFLTLHISDLPKPIQHCKVHHFADNTDLFHTGKSAKTCSAKFLNVQKNELAISKSLRKILWVK